MDFYNTEIECKYREFEDERESDLIYKKNLIEIFKLEDSVLNEDLFKEMDNSVRKLKEYLISKSYYQKIMDLALKASKQFILEDEYVGFMVLFSYDFCDRFHELLCESIESNSIPEEKYNVLLGLLSNNVDST